MGLCCHGEGLTLASCHGYNDDKGNKDQVDYQFNSLEKCLFFFFPKCYVASQSLSLGCCSLFGSTLCFVTVCGSGGGFSPLKLKVDYYS